MSDMLIVKRDSVPQIICFPYILFVTSSTLNNVNYIFFFFFFFFFALQDMFSFTLKDLFLNFTDEPSRIYLHKPHLGSLHFRYASSSICFIVNLAFVNNRF